MVLVALIVVTIGAGHPRPPCRTAVPGQGQVGLRRPGPPSDNGAYILDDGEFRTFTLAAAVSGGPSDINDRGDVVGPYTDAAGVQHGFRVDRRGCLVLVDYPGAPRSKNEALGINDRGQIVGVYGNYGDETTGESHATRGAAAGSRAMTSPAPSPRVRSRTTTGARSWACTATRAGTGSGPPMPTASCSTTVSSPASMPPAPS